MWSSRFCIDLTLAPHYGPGVESDSHGNKQERSVVGKGGRCAQLTTLPSTHATSLSRFPQQQVFVLVLLLFLLLHEVCDISATASKRNRLSSRVGFDPTTISARCTLKSHTLRDTTSTTLCAHVEVRVYTTQKQVLRILFRNSRLSYNFD